MSYEVIARKWRPQQFDDLVGQAHVTQTLKNAISSDRIAHAYLFVGPRGIGKTSVARIFSKALNCEKGSTDHPCDECDSCKEIINGSSLDVMEIDGASNNGVEQVRDLRETVKYAPNRGRYKIYIIDEVHMLSTAAFNALLKTLEEPPSHVKFIFATTEPQKILATIVSRCQRFDLRRIPVPLIMERLKLIADAENVQIDEDALLAIARGAEGGLRDAESALDQLISFRGDKIAEEDVLSVFGLVARGTLENLADTIIDGDIKSIINVVAELDEAGKDMPRLVIELIEHFRNLLICVNVGDDTDGLDLTEAQISTLKSQSAKTDMGRILRITGVLSDAEDKMRYALSRRTLVETALIRCCRASKVVSLEELIRQVEELKKNLTNGHVIEQPKELDLSPSADSEEEAPEVLPEPAPLDADAEEDLDLLITNWRELISIAGKIAPLAKSVLIDCRPKAVTSSNVVISLDPEFADEIENLKAGRNRKAVENALTSLLKRKVTAEFVLGDQSDDIVETEPEPIDVDVEPEPESTPVESAPVEKEEEPDTAGPTTDQRELLDDEAVRKTMEMFDGEIVGIR